MPRMIFVNLPVGDLDRSKAFYEAVGFTPDPRFTDHTAAAMQWSDTISVMLLSHDKWKTFTDKEIPDAHRSAQVALCLSMDNRADVDAMVDKAVAAGGKGDLGPAQDYDFMYGRDFDDPDGHHWEVMWMDMAAFEQNAAATENA